MSEVTPRDREENFSPPLQKVQLANYLHQEIVRKNFSKKFTITGVLEAVVENLLLLGDLLSMLMVIFLEKEQYLL